MVTKINSFSRSGLHFQVTDDGPLSGEVVILLHGFPEGPSAWAEVAATLEKSGYRVIIPNQRGYSLNARPTKRKAYEIAELVQDVVALIDTLQADRIHLVGHDWGGMVAWWVAYVAPERIKSLSTVSTPHPRAYARGLLTSRQLFLSWYILFFQLPIVPEWLIMWHRGSIGVRWLKKAGLAEKHARSYLDKFLHDPTMLTGAINWYRALVYSIGRTNKLGPIVVPTLYIWGSRDIAVSKTSAALTKRWVNAQYEFKTLDKASHWLPQDSPGVLAELINQHIKQHTKENS